MTALTFYLGALALFALGALCIRGTSVLDRSGAAEYLVKRKRRVAGIILLIAAAMSLATGLTSQFSSTAPATAKSAPTVPPLSTPAPKPPPAATNVAATPAPLPAAQVDPNRSPHVAALLDEATQLMRENRYLPAMHDVVAALKLDPDNPAAYALRGNLFATKKMWTQAEADYATAIRLDRANLPLKFDLGQIDFAQKKYADARPFFAAAQPDPDIGDLAQYEVFLCDLLGGHEDVAAQELDVFNQVGSNASYYFANAAWSLTHHDKAKAREWLTSAGHIYTPYKFKLYADNLIGLADAGPTRPPVQ
jgi:Tfp pilus assembly protein PilF